MKTTEIDLQRFCGDGESRYSFNAPWVKDGWKNATDGTILVRIPVSEPDSTPDFTPPLDKIAKWDMLESVCLTPLEQAEIVPGKRRCGECNGTGLDDCPHCGQSMPCEICDGKGKFDETQMRVGHAMIGQRYAELLKSLPSVFFRLPEPAKAAAIWFRFDGGVGAVMPCKTEDA